MLSHDCSLFRANESESHIYTVHLAGIVSKEQHIKSLFFPPSKRQFPKVPFHFALRSIYLNQGLFLIATFIGQFIGAMTAREKREKGGRGFVPSPAHRALIFHAPPLIYAPPANHSLIKFVPKARPEIKHTGSFPREAAWVGPPRARTTICASGETSAVSSIIRTCASDCLYMQEWSNLWLQRLPTEWNI